VARVPHSASSSKQWVVYSEYYVDSGRPPSKTGHKGRTTLPVIEPRGLTKRSAAIAEKAAKAITVVTSKIERVHMSDIYSFILTLMPAKTRLSPETRSRRSTAASFPSFKPFDGTREKQF